MPPEAAEELVELLVDKPGEADETLLDEALESLEGAAPHLPGEIQQAVGAGELVAIQLDVDEIAAARTLIENDAETEPSTIRRLADRLSARVRRAKERAQTRGSKRRRGSGRRG